MMAEPTALSLCSFSDPESAFSIDAHRRWGWQSGITSSGSMHYE